MSIQQAQTIRPAALSDCVSIRDIATAAWHVAYREILTPEFMAHELQREYSDDALRHQMSELGHCFCLLEVGDKAAGFVSYSVSEHVMTIHKLYLQPDIKGKGYGAALMAHAEQEARNAHCLHLELKVNRFNPAVGFYQKQGFEIVCEEDTIVGEDAGKPFWRNDYVMRKTLGRDPD